MGGGGGGGVDCEHQVFYLSLILRVTYTSIKLSTFLYCYKLHETFLTYECLILLKSTFLNAESRCISIAEWLKHMVSARDVYVSMGSIPDGFLFT